MSGLALAESLSPPPWFLGDQKLAPVERLQIDILAAHERAVAGRIQCTGAGADYLNVGDAVFGWEGSPVCLARKPRVLTFVQAAAVVIPAVTALQMVCDHAVVLPAHRVLVLGADTPTGAYVAQLARWRGAEVFTSLGPRVDLILDSAGRMAQLGAIACIKTCGAVISSVSLLDPEVSEERFIRSAVARPVMSRTALSRVAALFDSGVLTFTPEMPCRART